MLAQNPAKDLTADSTEIVGELNAVLATASEWLLSDSTARGFAVQRDEIEIAQRGDNIFFGCLTARGWQTWRVVGWRQNGEKLLLETARKVTKPAETLELVPRVSIESLQADVNAARLAAAHELAEIARRTLSNHAKIERVSLNASNQRGKVGTIARVLLVLPNRKTVAVCGSVVEKTAVESFLASALLWFAKLQERRTTNELWLIAEEKSIENLQKLHALLREGWRTRIKVESQRVESQRVESQRVESQRVVSRESENQNSESANIGFDSRLTTHDSLTLSDLWREKPKKLRRAKTDETSETAAKFLSLAPEAIDVVRSKHGENLRFNGLPFVRIREILGEQRVWFGVESKSKKVFEPANFDEFEELFEQLRQNRRHDAPDKRNKLYKSAPESWLESILRRDVSRLDPNLILAPVYAQFRVSNKPGALDLLALRTDGRLVVIELKTAPDREHALQAANYWRQVEAQRRAGNIARAKLFGDLKILDLPPLVYLVAPLMSFHHDFEVLTNALTPEIEFWRFDLNEDWRAGIRVARRGKVNL